MKLGLSLDFVVSFVTTQSSQNEASFIFSANFDQPSWGLWKPPHHAQKNEKRDDLEKKRLRLKDQIRAEVHLLPSEPKLLGVARVTPEATKTITETQQRSNKEIEMVGMRVSEKYEKDHDRIPEDISAVEAQQSSMANGAFRYSIYAREEELRPHDDSNLRSFYQEWGRRTGRWPHDSGANREKDQALR